MDDEKSARAAYRIAHKNFKETGEKISTAREALRDEMRNAREALDKAHAALTKVRGDLTPEEMAKIREAKIARIKEGILKDGLTKEQLLNLAANAIYEAENQKKRLEWQRQFFIEDKKKQPRKAANARHSQPGGTRDKQNKIRELWAAGIYRSRAQCAESEHDKLGMSLETAKKALRNTPTPENRASARKG